METKLSNEGVFGRRCNEITKWFRKKNPGKEKERKREREKERKREREKERKRGRRIDSTCHYETCIDVESFPADVLPLSFAKVSKPHYNCF